MTLPAIPTTIVEQPASSRLQIVIASLSALVMLLGAALIPSSSVPLQALPHLAGVYGACITIVDLVTFILLRTQGRRQRAHQIVAAAYLYAGLMAAIHMLHFPAAILPDRAVFGNADTVGWIFLAWKIGFPSFLLWAVIVQHQAGNGMADHANQHVFTIAVAAVAGAVALAHIAPLHPYLPSDDAAFALWTSGATYFAAGLSLATIVAIWKTQLFRRSLYAWITAVLFADAVGLLLTTSSGGRFTVGWYASRIESLLASVVVLAFMARHFRVLQDALSLTVEELHGRTQALQAEIHRRETAEGLLLQSQKLEAVGQLAAGLAHDFNNLMQVVSTRMEVIRRKAQGAVIDDDVAVIRRTLHRAEGLTRQLLLFSGRRTLQPEVIQLHTWMPPLMDLLGSLVRDDITLILDAPADLWPIRLDPSELESALVNLVSNARDAMPAGGQIGVVVRNEHVAGGDPSGLVVISVEDEGQGISPETLERVFEPFFTTKEAGRGSGLGLSQVYAFATRSQGSVAIESVPGRGTTVNLRFPRADAAEAVAAAAPHAPSTPLRLGQRQLILLVDDSEDVRESTRHILELLGHVVRSASTGKEALELVRDGLTPDVVVSDIVMPGGVDGITLGRRLRELLPTARIILSTGYSTAAGEAVAENFTVLQKPYQADALQRVMHGEDSRVIPLNSRQAPRA